MWYRQVLGTSDNRRPKQALERLSPGKRKRGRPGIRWIKGIRMQWQKDEWKDSGWIEENVDWEREVVSDVKQPKCTLSTAHVMCIRVDVTRHEVTSS
jgi:hypothetical protein